jgi:hypothetical protein
MRRIILVFTTLLMSGPWLSVAQIITAQEANSSRDRQEYESQTSGNYSNGNGIVSVDTDKWVSWNGPDDSTVYMQTDDQTPLFFASGSSGIQGAPWMVEGHLYTFILQDANGTEIAWARFKPDRTP